MRQAIMVADTMARLATTHSSSAVSIQGKRLLVRAAARPKTAPPKAHPVGHSSIWLSVDAVKRLTTKPTPRPLTAETQAHEAGVERRGVGSRCFLPRKYP